MAYSGIKFFYTVTLPRDWDVLKRLRRPKQKTLPSVLTHDEVHRLIGAVQQPRHAAFFWTAYTLGLRLEEGLHLQVGDLDSGRMMVHVHRGKGAKDRLASPATSSYAAFCNTCCRATSSDCVTMASPAPTANCHRIVSYVQRDCQS